MSILSIIAALLLDNIKPFDRYRYLICPLGKLAHYLEQQFNTENSQSGLLAWMVGTLPITLAFGALWSLLHWISPMLAWLFNAAIVYVLIDFKNRTTLFSDVIAALEDNDTSRAKALLTHWTNQPLAHFDREQLICFSIQSMLKSSLFVFFAPAFWFIVLPGPIGIIFYCLSLFYARVCAKPDDTLSHLNQFSTKILYWLDWIPMYLLAATFALVGNFLDVTYVLRVHTPFAENDRFSPLLWAGAAAIGIACPAQKTDDSNVTPVSAEKADIGHLQILMSLLWRALIAWLLVFGILSLLF